MHLRTPPTTPSLRKSEPFGSTPVSAGAKRTARWRAPAMVDEDAVTLRLRPLRWRDRMLPEVIRWAGAVACVAAVTGGWLLVATPSEAARIDEPALAEPMAPARSKASPVLASTRLDPGGWTPTAVTPPEEEDEVIILEDEDEDEAQILIFDDALDGPSSAAMAEAHFERRQYAMALQYSMQAADAEPKNPVYQELLGDAYVLCGDSTPGRKAFRRARRLRRD